MIPNAHGTAPGLATRVGETHFFFGCRNKDVDFIYREEMEKYAAEGSLTLHTAFSRDEVETETIIGYLNRSLQYDPENDDVRRHIPVCLNNLAAISAFPVQADGHFG